MEAGALLALKERLEAAGALTPAARDMLEKALQTESPLAPEEVEVEVDADEEVRDIAVRLGVINQELAQLTEPEIWSQLEPETREALIEQLGYSARLVAWLEEQG